MTHIKHRWNYRIGFLVLIIVMMLLSVMSVSALTATNNKEHGASDIKVTLLNQDPDPVEPGEHVEVRWRIENKGAGAVENLKLRVEENGPIKIASHETLEKNIGTLDARQIGKNSYVVNWEFAIAEDALEGDYEITLFYQEGKVSVKLEDFKIKVKSRDSVVFLEDVKLVPERTRAGEEVRITISLRNLADAAVDDVRVKLDLKDLPFATVGSTGEKAIKKLLAGQTAETTFHLIADGNAASKVHRIPVKVNYMNREGKTFETTTNFGLLVDNPPEFIINLDETKVFKAKKKGRIVISYSNIGKSDINFVVLRLLPSDDYEILSPATSYLGNLESDDYETAEYDIYVKKSKDINLKIEAIFKDSFNEDYTIVKELPMNIYSSRELKKYGLGTQGSSMGFWIIVLIIIGLIYYLHRKGKLRRIKWLRRLYRRQP